MASELVRVKVQNDGGVGLEGALVRIFDEGNTILKAQGITSKGPSPALGIFETTLEGSASPGTLYIVRVLRNISPVRTDTSIRVIT